MNEYLIYLTAYNSWANKKIKGFIMEAGEEMTLKMQSSSFPTIQQTILHILDAQTIWFSRLQGISPVSWPGQSFNGTSADACEMLIESCQHYEKYVKELTEKELMHNIGYRNMKGDAFIAPVQQILVHVMNHGTFHRGQLVTMLRGAGFTNLSSTDMIAYFRENQ